MRICYGINKYTHIDITELCLQNDFLHFKNDFIYIPCNDHIRGALFSDPFPYILKKIFIVNDDIVTEIDDKSDVEINLITNQIKIINQEEIHNRLNNNNTRCQIYFNGNIIMKFPSNYRELWYGQFSVARVNGPIIHYVEQYLKKIKNNLLCIVPICDGDIQSKDIEDLHISSMLHRFSNIIIGTLSQKTEDPLYKYLYLPLDDNFFELGISHFFPPEQLPTWEERKAIAFWRGGCSGGGMESARCRTVGELIDYEYADVKCLSRYGWNNGKNIPEHYFGNEVHYTEYMKYKFVLIIDGNIIASSHMWTFAIGAVPLLISNGICWFSKFLKPYENYVPINYDLSNLKETIEWLLKNDDKAKQIAENALQFSRDYFSSEFQKKYIETEINNLL